MKKTLSAKTALRILLTFLILSTSLLAFGCSTSKTASSSSETTPAPSTEIIEIGITQIVEHPSLDLIRSGIEAALKDQGFDSATNLKIDYQNAQGNMENTQLIAQKFNNKNKKLVIAITTPSAQAAFQTVKDVPVIFSAVTDPKGAGLDAKGITGVSDMTPIRKQLELLKQLLPEAKTVGMVYNTGEQNSVVQVELAEKIAKELGLEIVSTGVSNTNDMPQALDQILSKSDVFYAHVDNSLATAFTLLAEKANTANVPIIGAVENYVTDGALATDGIDNYDIGYQTGLMAAKILKGESVENLPIETVANTQVIISKKVAERFKINIPEALKGKLI